MVSTRRVIGVAMALLGALASSCSQLGLPSASSQASTTSPVCRLPVSLGAVSGGWLGYPSGTVAEDPTAGGVNDGSGFLKTKAQPVLMSASGTLEFTYSSTLKRWLPGPPPLVSPDGTAYVWTEYETDKPVTLTDLAGRTENWELTRVHFTQARTGTDRILTQDSLYHAVALSATSVYLSKDLYGGLARLDLATGHVYPLVEGKFGWLIAGGYAWATDGGDGKPYGTLYRADLAVGTTQPFFSQPGALAVIIHGIDASDTLLVEVQRQPNGQFTRELWTASGLESRLLTDNPPPLGGWWIVDTLGVWLSGDDGVYLWRSGQVSRVVESPGRVGMVPVGVCVPRLVGL